jgi:hypothetical protein
MFAPDSRVVRHPQLMREDQQLCLQAISFAARSIMKSLEGVKAIADNIEGDSKISEADYILLYQTCWSVIDQTHMLSQLLRTLDKTLDGGRLPPEIISFCDKYAVATLMRNNMDHLYSKIHNLSASKDRRSTAFGALSFFNWNGPETPDGEIITVVFGPLSRHYRVGVVNPAGQDVGIGASLFKFSSLDLILDIHTLLSDVPALAKHLDAILHKNREEWLRELASEGLNEEALGQPGDRLVVGIKVRFGNL